MQFIFINQSSHEISEDYLNSWVSSVLKELNNREVYDPNEYSELTLVFQDESDARSLNHQFRNKDYATDILSFSPIEEGSLGELVVCPQVVSKQAQDNGWSFEKELYIS